jgi:CopG family nickel-responsive transcriptional regulator
MIPKRTTRPISRISISLPQDLQADVDEMVARRGFGSRSQAIADMLRQHVAEHRAHDGDEVMAGTITILYDNGTPGLQQTLAELQYRHLDEVISSLHVHLMDHRTLEVILVQGPAQTVLRIADQIVTLRGVITGRLQLMAAVIPPLHPLPAVGLTAQTVPGQDHEARYRQ